MENKKGLSIAVMLSVVGLLGLGFGTCMGMLLDGKSMAAALIFAASVVVGGALGLFLAVKAKTVDNEFTKWKKYEFVGLAICVAVIVLLHSLRFIPAILSLATVIFVRQATTIYRLSAP